MLRMRSGDDPVVDLLSKFEQKSSSLQVQKAVSEVILLVPEIFQVPPIVSTSERTGGTLARWILGSAHPIIAPFYWGFRKVGRRRARRISAEAGHAEQAVELLARVNQAEAVSIAKKIGDAPESEEVLDKAVGDLREVGVSSENSSREIILIIVTWLVLLGFPIAISELPVWPTAPRSGTADRPRRRGCQGCKCGVSTSHPGLGPWRESPGYL